MFEQPKVKLHGLIKSNQIQNTILILKRKKPFSRKPNCFFSRTDVKAKTCTQNQDYVPMENIGQQQQQPALPPKEKHYRR